MALYLFALCNEIYAIAKNPLESKYNKRANVFHIVNQTICVLLVILLCTLVEFESGNDGKL